MVISGSNRKGSIVSLFFIVVSLFPFAEIAFGAEISVIPDKSLFIQIFNFLLILWILNVLLYKPIRKTLIQRQDRFTNLEQNIDTLNNEAQNKNDAYASGIHEARIQGLKQKDALLQAAAAEEREIIQEINQKAQENLAAVREKIAKDTESVRESLQQEIDTFSNAISERILGRAI
jgi:F-type H+-transporting ATPase subunit b